jgi:hypothetical protein
MVYFTQIEKTEHYKQDHAEEVPWDKVQEILANPDQIKTRGNILFFYLGDYYLICKIEENVLRVLDARNAKTCPKCNGELKTTEVKVADIGIKICYQCLGCEYFSF